MADIKSMREDAIRRAREMHSRAIPKVEQPKQNVENEKSYQQQAVPVVDNPSEQVNDEQNVNPDFLQSFFKDKEKMLILALLVILSQEEGNNSLLFALMYLLI